MILWWTNGGGVTSAEKYDIWLLKLAKSFAYVSTVFAILAMFLHADEKPTTFTMNN